MVQGNAQLMWVMIAVVVHVFEEHATDEGS